MQVTVDKIEMMQKIEQELKEYEVEYTEAVTKYKTALKEYYDYIDRVIKKGSIKRVDMAPQPPISKREQFEEHLDILKSHIKGEVVMEDHEYTEMLKGIQSVKMSMRDTSVNYVEVATGFANKVVT